MGGWMVYLFWIKEIIVAFIFMAITSFMIRMLTSMRYVVTSDDMLVIEYGLQFLNSPFCLHSSTTSSAVTAIENI